MSRIGEKFKQLRVRRQRALIPFITVGDPNLTTTKALVLEMAEKGADIIELGVPFSDPIADGPTIQGADVRALAHHTSLKDALALVEDLRRLSSIPLVLMSYCNPIYRYGLKRLVFQAKEKGVDGLIVCDLPIEEANTLQALGRIAGLDTIFLAAPTTDPARMRLIAQKSKGFIYYISLTGVTGARDELSKTLIPSLKKLQRLTTKPIAVGFGISNPDQVRELVPYADGVVVGSAIISCIEKNLRNKKLVSAVGDFVERLARAAHGGGATLAGRREGAHDLPGAKPCRSTSFSQAERGGQMKPELMERKRPEKFRRISGVKSPKSLRFQGKHKFVG